MVAGLTITAAASFAHDVYANVHQARARRRAEGSEVRVARITAVVIGIVAILGGILANGQNIAFLVALAFAVAASANLPTILYSLFWKRFNTRGALWSIYGGLISCVDADRLLAGGLRQAGRPGHRAEPVDDHRRRRSTSTGSRWTTPGIVSIPLAFFLGWLGTVTEQGASQRRRSTPRWRSAR